MTKDELIEFLYKIAKYNLAANECPADSDKIDKCSTMNCIDCWNDFIKNRYKNFKKEDDVV